MARTPVEEIKERLSILDVIGAYVELKHAGKSYKGKSPFTNEKTPSFYVSPDRGMYYCFSSQKGGDMFTFIQEMEGVDFKTALKILAEKAHVELVPEDPKMRDEREAQYALVEEATKYFYEAREAVLPIQTYIEGRGVKMNTVISWRIGYARDEWRSLRNYLTEKGFTDAHMLKAGLIKKADQGKEPYDVFRDRIMFPIMDTGGRVVAFSGRTLKTEPGIPKYVNSPETELFQKSEILYGYDKARHGIRQYDFSLVVEGQFDLVLAHQAGYTNTVAVSGTALTKHHIMLLMRLSQNVVLALDADRAGISAVKRSSLPMLQAGMNVKVAHMPDGMDPADIVRKDPQELKRIVGNAVHVVEFLLNILKVQTKDERTYKLRVREEILPLIASIDNRIDREHFEGVVAVAIGATKDGVHYEVERLAEIAMRSESKSQQPIHPKTPDEQKSQGQKHALMAQICAYLHILVGDRDPIGKQVREQLEKIVGDAEMQKILENESTYTSRGELFILEEQLEGIKDRQLIEDIGDTLTRFSHLIARERLNVLRKKLTEPEVQGDHEKALSILQEAKHAEQLLQSKIQITVP